MKLFYFLCLVLVSCSLQAQNLAFQESPGFIEMVKIKKDPQTKLYNEVAKYLNVGVFRAGERLKVNIVNSSSKKYYYTLIDLQPDNKVNILFPIENESPDDYFLLPDNRINLDYEIVVTPPYGIDKLITIFSEKPFNLRSMLENKSVNRASGTHLTSEELLQEIKWILEGKPTRIFEDCLFSTADLVVLQEEDGSKGPSVPKSSGWASQNINWKWVDCNRINEGDKLYTIYPLIDFIQPLQSGASRGVIALDVETQGYVLKGRAIALKGIQKVLVNGVEASVHMITDQKFAWEKEIRLQNGSNTIKVTAITSEGKENCETLELVYDERKQQAVAAGKNYLFLVGINEYESWPKLRGAVNDVLEVKRLLTSHYQFAPENTIELINERATRDAIDSVFRVLLRNLSSNDNLVVYFAGHGILDKELNTGYWIPVDARKKKYTDYIKNADIQQYLEPLKARHSFIVADACFSGSFLKGSRGESFEDKVEKLRSKWIFCSGREEEVADLMPGKQNSPFAYYLLKFLTECTEKISVSELSQKVMQAVANNSSQVPIAGPIVNTGDEGGQFIFRRK